MAVAYQPRPVFVVSGAGLRSVRVLRVSSEQRGPLREGCLQLVGEAGRQEAVAAIAGGGAPFLLPLEEQLLDPVLDRLDLVGQAIPRLAVVDASEPLALALLPLAAGRMCRALPDRDGAAAAATAEPPVPGFAGFGSVAFAAAVA